MLAVDQIHSYYGNIHALKGVSLDVYEGEIVFADYHLGYGKLIIIEHSSNFHSLYGHCDRFFKKQGDVVKKGELIAVAGDTGSALGKTLHFEIRKDIKAQDPIKWLIKK